LEHICLFASIFQRQAVIVKLVIVFFTARSPVIDALRSQQVNSNQATIACTSPNSLPPVTSVKWYFKSW